MLAQLRPTLLTEYVGTQLEVSDDPARVFDLTLTSVVTHIHTEQMEAFSIFFHGPPEPFMSQGIRKLNHPILGELSMFLVPIGQDKDGFQYEAVFNHMIR